MLGASCVNMEDSEFDTIYETHLLNVTVPLDNGQRGYVFSKTTPTNGAVEYFCYVCQISFNAWQILLTHASGKKHSTAMQKSNHPSYYFTRTCSEEAQSGQYSVDNICVIQARIVKSKPLIGLEYLLELVDDNVIPNYCCLLCDKYGPENNIMVHLSSQQHNMNYFKCFFPLLCSALSLVPTSTDYKKGAQILLNRIVRKIVTDKGQLKPKRCSLDTYLKEKNSVLEEIENGPHISETINDTYINMVDWSEILRLHDCDSDDEDAPLEPEVKYSESDEESKEKFKNRCMEQNNLKNVQLCSYIDELNSNNVRLKREKDSSAESSENYIDYTAGDRIPSEDGSTSEERLLLCTVPLDDGQLGYVLSEVENEDSGRLEYFCCVCQAPLNTWQTVLNHISGKKHTKAMRKSSHPCHYFDKVIDLSESQYGDKLVARNTQRTKCSIQAKLDAYKLHPLIGLEYVVELTAYNTVSKYYCLLCKKQGFENVMIVHLTSQQHYFKYLMKFFPMLCKAIPSCCKEDTELALHHILKQIEKKYGRMKPRGCSIKKFNMEEELEDIEKGFHIRETINDRAEWAEIKRLQLNTCGGRKKSQHDSSLSTYTNSVKNVVRKRFRNRSASPSPPRTEKYRTNSRYYRRSRSRSPFNEKRRNSYDSQSRSRSPHSRYRSTCNARSSRNSSPTLPYTQNRRRSYSKSHSKSPVPRKLLFIPKNTKEEPQSEDDKVKIQSKDDKDKIRSESVYIKILPHVKSKVSGEQIVMQNKKQETTNSKDAEAKINFYKKFPEKHSQYLKEWGKFWNRRSKELLSVAADVPKHDFVTEWTTIWHNRLKEMYDDGLKIEENDTEVNISTTMLDPGEIKRDNVLKDKLQLQDSDELKKDINFKLKLRDQDSEQLEEDSEELRLKNAEQLKQNNALEEKLQLQNAERLESDNVLRKTLRIDDSEQLKEDNEDLRLKNAEQLKQNNVLKEKLRLRVDEQLERRKETLELQEAEKLEEDNEKLLLDELKTTENPIDGLLHNDLKTIAPDIKTTCKALCGAEIKTGIENAELNQNLERNNAISVNLNVDLSEESFLERNLFSPGAFEMIISDNSSKVVSTLRSISVLENQIGSLGPIIFCLLTKAIAMEKIARGSSQTLLYSQEYCVLFETVKEKLKGLFIAGLIDKHYEKAAKLALFNIVDILTVPSESCSRTSEISDSNSAPAQITIPGIGVVNKVAFAQQIANALHSQGKTDATEQELEQLINASITMAQASCSKSDKLLALKVNPTFQDLE